VTQNEALGVLDAALNKNGYAALRNGRTLTTIISKDKPRAAISRLKRNDPEKIPSNDESLRRLSRFGT